MNTLMGMGKVIGVFSLLLAPAFAGANLIVSDTGPYPTSPRVSFIILAVWLVAMGYVVGNGLL